ncbi:Dolichyl-phosphate-mannose-protein mannosyltransferase-domain-containing protein [Sporodiniella umbellata]|nr:Dolichyl-phosphate-mannose-protein mannosyltransferase-domain-containing protein [Sporodiniella umbellata]
MTTSGMKARLDGWMACGLFALSLPVRFKKIASPAQVVFDEVHFGKYAAYYIQQSYFFDVHPPLAKLLIACIGWLAGFDGGFDFAAIGMDIPANVPYVQMRALSAFFGALVIPLAYLTIRESGHSRFASLMAGLALCFENGLITNNRLILLDSILLFFTAFTVFAYNRFYRAKPFSSDWWQWLCLTGLGIGCNISSKWVGFFTMAVVGLSTVKQLWHLLGHSEMTKTQLSSHFFSRVLGLLLIPVLVYVTSFYVHFSILTRPGTGDTFMPIEVQNELQGLAPVSVPLPVVYGSLITLRHLESGNGYLHSHRAFYPEGSQQQQITIYPFRDTNNWWRILKANTSETSQHDLYTEDGQQTLEYVRHGDYVRLEHVETAPRKLHSHDIAAPMTDTTYHKEVSGYGFPDFEGDSNDYWKVEIEEGDRLEARQSRFRLSHHNQLCRLYSNMERLPDWGFRQQEVSCIVEGKKPRTLWMVDEHSNELLPKETPQAEEHRPGFFEKFIYLQHKMWTVHQGLTEPHPYESRPSSWPVLLSGISFWSGPAGQIFLLGHPLVYWLSTITVFQCLILTGFFCLRDKRGYGDHFGGLRSFYETSGGFFAAAWAVHYLPFYTMERQLFSHHYMPALYFAVLTMAVGLDMLTRPLSFPSRLFFFLSLALAIVACYCLYAPLTYGTPWDLVPCEDAKLLDSWIWTCEPSKDTLTEQEDDTWEGMLETASVEEEEDEVEPTTTLEELATLTEEEEEEEDDEPTELPVYEEPESNIVDGTEIFAEEDEDEDEWPSTVFGSEFQQDPSIHPKPAIITPHLEL